MTRRGVARALGRTIVIAATPVACATTPAQDTIYPACNDAPSAGLATESTASGQCPAHPTQLVGKATVGAQCTQASDCAPVCCQCSNGQGALVAQCASGSCLDGTSTCCLYSQQCGS